MAYRYTNTDKWNDAWFSNLKPIEKLLFNYLCDNCDCAGFIEIIVKNWANDIGTEKKQIEGALKGLARGLIYSNSNDCVFLRTFLKHQKNLPLNENNQAHKGIIKRFLLYSDKFDIKDINDFIEGAIKGLGSPYGNGIGNGIDNVIKNNVLWRNDFEVYKSELEKEYKELINDSNFISTQERLNPNVNIKLSIEKGYLNFWSTEAGWKHKKKSKSNELNWKSTLTKSIDMNKVYSQKKTPEKGLFQQYLDSKKEAI